jgi:hypothetical protein
VTDFVTGRETMAEELLWLLNDRQPIALDRTRFAVITGTYTPRPTEPSEWPFRRGEVIPIVRIPGHWDAERYVHTDYDQELFGQRRSFGPWDMFRAVYTTSDVLNAVEVAELAANNLDGFYERLDGHWRLYSDQVEAEREWCSTLEPLRIGDYSWER